MIFIMKILTVSLTLCAILTISQAGPINSTGFLDKGLCAYKKQYCSNLAGSFCPKCDANGNFLPQQCSGSTGYCWCVNTETGNEIPNTKTPPGVIPVNCMKRECPDGWFQFGNRCFSYISSAKTWTEAQIYCQFDGGNLASIHSYEENKFVQTLIRGNTHDFPETWIGGTDAIHSNLWMWIDGSKFYYENWCNDNDHDDNEDHDHDNTSEHDSHDDDDDDDHDNNTSEHDSHHDDDHDHEHDHEHDPDHKHDHEHDHDHGNTSQHDNHDDDHDDDNNTSEHDSHDDTNEHDSHDDTSKHDSHDNTSEHDSHDDTSEHHSHDSDGHVDHYDHHSHYKRTSSCLRMNCHYKMKWCSAACDDAFPFVCSKTI